MGLAQGGVEALEVYPGTGEQGEACAGHQAIVHQQLLVLGVLAEHLRRQGLAGFAERRGSALGDWLKLEHFSVTGGRLNVALSKRFSDVVQFVGIFQAETWRPRITGVYQLHTYFRDILAFVNVLDLFLDFTQRFPPLRSGSGSGAKQRIDETRLEPPARGSRSGRCLAPRESASSPLLWRSNPPKISAEIFQSNGAKSAEH